jgi:hypothetical protein
MGESPQLRRNSFADNSVFSNPNRNLMVPMQPSPFVSLKSQASAALQRNELIKAIELYSRAIGKA